LDVVAHIGGDTQLDHVFVGRWEGAPAPDAAEVDGWRWVSLDDLARDAEAHPDAYTPWIRMILADPRRREELARAAQA
jgi:isopentenyl-diphosphate delta-isomerase